MTNTESGRRLQIESRGPEDFPKISPCEIMTFFGPSLKPKPRLFFLLYNIYRLNLCLHYCCFSFTNSNGPFPSAYFPYWQDVETTAQLCLSGLNDTERQCVNGEILGIELLLAEVLQNGYASLDTLEGKLFL